MSSCALVPIETIIGTVDNSADLQALLDERENMAWVIREVTAIDGAARTAIDFCLKGAGRKNGQHMPDASAILDANIGIAALDATLWRRAIDMTDVYNIMPAARRSEWNDAIHENTAPEFVFDNVIPTFKDLLASREKFFAERIDGIFRGLSRSHVTNRPEAFGKRMILEGAWHGWMTGTTASNLITDLRSVVAKFMGRGDVDHGSTDLIIRCAVDNSGQWMSVDGGAIRIRVYKGAGTAHIELHEDMAWRLNAVLATLYPAAIPDANRKAPPRERKTKAPTPIQSVFPFSVAAILLKAKQAETVEKNANGRGFTRTPIKNAVSLDARTPIIDEVMAYLGGVQHMSSTNIWHFDYYALDVVKQTGAAGFVPEKKSHQYYPTPEVIVDAMTTYADIESDHRLLEPSAGTGNIAVACAQYTDNITCVELSSTHCNILRAKGHDFDVIHGDFIKIAAGMRVKGQTFDRIMMNPPFTGKQWMDHIEAARTLLAPNGRLVSVVPASAINSYNPPGSTYVGDVWSGEFAGTGVSVRIIVIDKE